MNRLKLLSAWSLALLAAACSPESQGAVSPPLAASGPVPELSLASGAAAPRTYATACAACHDNGGYGVRVLADRLGPDNALVHEGNRLSPEAVRAIVRNGMGAMPAMSRLEVSDEELDGIIASLGPARASGR